MEPYSEVLILLLIALGGVGAIGLLLYWTGTLQDAVIENMPDACRQIQIDLPDFQISEIVLSTDQKFALAAETLGSRIALIYSFGDKLTTRELNARDIIASRLSGGSGKRPLTLRIEVADFARPHFDIVLYAPPSLELCLCKENDLVNDNGDQKKRVQEAREIGNAWVARMTKIASS